MKDTDLLFAMEINPNFAAVEKALDKLVGKAELVGRAASEAISKRLSNIAIDISKNVKLPAMSGTSSSVPTPGAVAPGVTIPGMKGDANSTLPAERERSKLVEKETRELREQALLSERASRYNSPERGKERIKFEQEMTFAREKLTKATYDQIEAQEKLQGIHNPRLAGPAQISSNLQTTAINIPAIMEELVRINRKIDLGGKAPLRFHSGTPGHANLVDALVEPGEVIVPQRGKPYRVPVPKHGPTEGDVVPVQLEPGTEVIPKNKSQAFSSWFGSGAVKDKQGKPKVVYHTSRNDFDQFDTIGGTDFGSHFGNHDQVNDMAMNKTRKNTGPGEGVRTYPVYLNLKNPFRLPDVGHFDYDTIKFHLKTMEEEGTNQKLPKLKSVPKLKDPPELAMVREQLYAYNNEMESIYDVPMKEGRQTTAEESARIAAIQKEREVLFKKQNDLLKQRGSQSHLDKLQRLELIRAFEEAGYDGLVYKNEGEGTVAADSYVAFHPNQIKSAIANTGAYDPADPRIHMSHGGIFGNLLGSVNNFAEKRYGKKGMMQAGMIGQLATWAATPLAMATLGTPLPPGTGVATSLIAAEVMHRLKSKETLEREHEEQAAQEAAQMEVMKRYSDLPKYDDTPHFVNGGKKKPVNKIGPIEGKVKPRWSSGELKKFEGEADTLTSVRQYLKSILGPDPLDNVVGRSSTPEERVAFRAYEDEIDSYQTKIRSLVKNYLEESGLNMSGSLKLVKSDDPPKNFSVAPAGFPTTIVGENWLAGQLLKSADTSPLEFDYRPNEIMPEDFYATGGTIPHFDKGGKFTGDIKNDLLSMKEYATTIVGDNPLRSGNKALSPEQWYEKTESVSSEASALVENYLKEMKQRRGTIMVLKGSDQVPGNFSLGQQIGSRTLVGEKWLAAAMMKQKADTSAKGSLTQKEWETSVKNNEDWQNATYAWSLGRYSAMWDSQHNGSNPEFKKLGKDFLTAISNAPDTSVKGYRGIRGGEVPYFSKVGNKAVFDRPRSFSKDIETAAAFANKPPKMENLILEAPLDNAVDLASPHLSKYPFEREVINRPYTGFQVVGQRQERLPVYEDGINEDEEDYKTPFSSYVAKHKISPVGHINVGISTLKQLPRDADLRGIPHFDKGGKYGQLRELLYDSTGAYAHQLKDLPKFAAKVDKRIGSLRFTGPAAAAIPRESLGIPRTLMPQIAKEHLPDFMEHLKAQGVSTEMGTSVVKDLKPSQNEIGLEKIAKNSLKTEKQLAKKTIIVSSDGYIVDGHHGWAGMMVKDKDMEANVMRIGMPFKELLEVTRNYDKVGYKEVGQNEISYDNPKEHFASAETPHFVKGGKLGQKEWEKQIIKDPNSEDAIKQWVGGYNEELWKYSQSKKVSGEFPKRMQHLGGVLNNLLATAPGKEQTLYRGITNTKKNAFNPYRKTGQKVVFDSPKSFSTSKSVAEEFLEQEYMGYGDALLIEAKAKTGADISKLSKNDWEKEVISLPHTLYKISQLIPNGVEMSDRKADIVKMEELPPKTSAKDAIHLSKGGKLSKSDRAKAAHVLTDKQIQRYSEEHNEPTLAQMLKSVGGKWIPGNDSIDIDIPKLGGVELKTVIEGKNKKLTMKKSAMKRKADREAETGLPVHTVVFDDSDVYNALGEGEHDPSKRNMFYRRGFGSYRLGSMHQVGNLKELIKLLKMSDEDLPVAAQRMRHHPQGQMPLKGAAKKKYLKGLDHYMDGGTIPHFASGGIIPPAPGVVGDWRPVYAEPGDRVMTVAATNRNHSVINKILTNTLGVDTAPRPGKQLIYTTAGESLIPKNLADKHEPLLDAIHNGAHFASGGTVGHYADGGKLTDEELFNLKMAGENKGLPGPNLKAAWNAAALNAASVGATPQPQGSVPPIDPTAVKRKELLEKILGKLDAELQKQEEILHELQANNDPAIAKEKLALESKIQAVKEEQAKLSKKQEPEKEESVGLFQKLFKDPKGLLKEYGEGLNDIFGSIGKQYKKGGVGGVIDNYLKAKSERSSLLSEDSDNESVLSTFLGKSGKKAGVLPKATVVGKETVAAGTEVAAGAEAMAGTEMAAAAGGGPLGAAAVLALQAVKVQGQATAVPLKVVGSGLNTLSNSLQGLNSTLGPIGVGLDLFSSGLGAVADGVSKIPVIGDLLGPLLGAAAAIPGVIKNITQTLVGFAATASPGQFKMFQMAVEDVQGVIGGSFLPVLNMMRDGIRMIGDVLATILPNSEEVYGALTWARDALGGLGKEIREMFAEVGPLIREGLIVGLTLLSGAIWVVTKAIHGLVTVFRAILSPIMALNRALGGVQGIRASTGAAARRASMDSIESYRTQLQLAAYTNPEGPTAADAPRQLERIAAAAERILNFLNRMNPIAGVANVVANPQQAMNNLNGFAQAAQQNPIGAARAVAEGVMDPFGIIDMIRRNL